MTQIPNLENSVSRIVHSVEATMLAQMAVSQEMQFIVAQLNLLNCTVASLVRAAGGVVELPVDFDTILDRITWSVNPVDGGGYLLVTQEKAEAAASFTSQARGDA